MRISDWSSDVCSSDLLLARLTVTVPPLLPSVVFTPPIWVVMLSGPVLRVVVISAPPPPMLCANIPKALKTAVEIETGPWEESKVTSPPAPLRREAHHQAPMQTTATGGHRKRTRLNSRH